jgi:hypothetical protein
VKRRFAIWNLPSPRSSTATRLALVWLTTCACAYSATNPASPDEIPPLSPPLPEIAPTLWEQFGWVLWILVALLLVMVGVIVWVVLRPGKPPVLPATAAQAEVALRALQSQPETGAVLSQISQVLRRYLINAFWLSPLEMTTHDFCALVRGSEKIGPVLASSVAEFLQTLDQRKFAPAAVQPPLGAAGRALELVELAEARLRIALPPPPPPSVNPAQ